MPFDAHTARDVAAPAYNTRHKPAPLKALRPYHPVVFNKLSRTRFERCRMAELLRHLGRDPSYPERILISRIVSVEWWLLRVDDKLDRGGELSGHDIRGRLAAENRLRLDLLSLGLQQPAAKPADFHDHLRHIAERRRARV